MNEPLAVAIDPELNDELEPERYELREAPHYRFELDRREFLKTLGGGILVFCLLDAAEAQPPGPAAAAGAAEAEAGRRPRTSARGCTSVRTGRSRYSPAKPKSARTSARR